MIKSPASPVLEFFARVILQASRSGTLSEAISLAWTLRNSAVCESALSADGRSELDLEQARNLSEAMLSDLGAPGLADRTNGNGPAGRPLNGGDGEAFNRVLACVEMVWEGVIPDPTNGATRVHPHDQQPKWAREYEATALIGALLFFRSDSPDYGASSPH